MNEFKNPLQDSDCNELSISDQNQIILMLQSEDLDLIILAINVLMNSKRPVISINIQLKINNKIISFVEYVRSYINMLLSTALIAPYIPNHKLNELEQYAIENEDILRKLLNF